MKIAGALLDVVPTGVLVTDAEGIVVAANAALRSVFGAAADPTGRHIEELGDVPPYAAAAPLWRAWRGEPGRRRRCTLPHDRVVEGTWHRLDDLRALTVADRSDDARIRHRLRQHNRALAELVATKTELVSALLHEIRTPLAAARSMAQLLADDDRGDPLIAQAVQAVLRNLDRLTGVTDEIALISGIENGTIDVVPEPVPVTGLLEEVAERLRRLHVGATVTSVAGELPVDRARLEDVLTRLGAAVHAVSGARTPVQLDAGQTDGRWRISMPLPPDTAADQLFTSSAEHGNATALMLARAVVTRHGGTVAIENNALTVTLPGSAPTPASADPAG